MASRRPLTVRTHETLEESPASAVERQRDVLEWLVDNADAYDTILHAVGAARRSVWIVQLAFDADCVAYVRRAGSSDPASVRRAGSSDPASVNKATVLAEAILAAVARAPVDVRILLNESLLLNTARRLRRFFDVRIAGCGAIAGTIQVRGISSFPRLLHSKIVIVDGHDGFLPGSPFVNGYWDDERHLPVDARRPHRELGGRPLHDVSLRITGDPVASLERIFAELWDCAAGDPVKQTAAADPCRSSIAACTRAACPPDTAPAAKAAVRVVSTSPRGVLTDRPAGSTEIMDALLEGIAGARSLIYIEHQYLSARPVVAALSDTLARQRDLELIVLLNQNPDVTAYRRWQNARLAESGLLTHPRAGVFALWSAAYSSKSEPVILNQLFVHSKVVVVDDVWAAAGSANLDGVSLHSYGDDFTGAVARRVFRHTRNFDVNVIRDDRRENLDVYASNRGSVAGLRTRLWSEHLDVPVASVTGRPRGGWLPLWRSRAAANVAALHGAAVRDTAARMRGFVLPYSTQPTPERQLADLGVRVDPARLDLRFKPGWLEVHFSPNWVRNMFS